MAQAEFKQRSDAFDKLNEEEALKIEEENLRWELEAREEANAMQKMMVEEMAEMQADAEAYLQELNDRVTYYIELNDDLDETTDAEEIKSNWEAVSELRDEIWDHKKEVTRVIAEAAEEKAAFEKMLAEQVAADEARIAEKAAWEAEEATVKAAEEAKQKEMARVQELEGKVAKFQGRLDAGDLTAEEEEKITKMKEAFDAELTKVEEKKETARLEFEKLEGARNKEKELKKAKQAKEAKEAEFNEQLENQKKLANKLKTQKTELDTKQA